MVNRKPISDLRFRLKEKVCLLLPRKEVLQHLLVETSSYDISAKTGTAQVFGLKKGEIYDESKLPDKLKDHALFIAFAPSKKIQSLL